MYPITPEAVYTAIACTAILVFGFYEYRRREQVHQLRMALLRRGELPPDPGRAAPVSRLVATVLVTLAYAGALGILVRLAAQAAPRYARSVLGVLLALLPPLVVLVLIIIRDFRRLTRARREAP